MTGTTWLAPTLRTETYDNQVYLYIGFTEPEKEPILRLKLEYKGEQMLFIRKFVFRIDDTVETIEPSLRLESDYVAEKHWEWFDELAEPHLELVQKIATGKKVLMRCQGSQHSYDRSLGSSEQEDLAQMLLVYRYLKEKRPAAQNTR